MHHQLLDYTWLCVLMIISLTQPEYSTKTRIQTRGGGVIHTYIFYGLIVGWVFPAAFVMDMDLASEAA